MRGLRAGAARYQPGSRAFSVPVAVSALLLFAAVSMMRVGGRPSALYSLGDSGMQGAVYMPEVNAGFPQPWDKPSGHPSLSSVQYMPPDSMEWYPDQGSEPAADQAGVQMLASVKPVRTARRIADPGEWLQRQVKVGFKSSVKQMLGGNKEGKKGRRVVPDPIEWMEERYLKHSKGAKVLARTRSAVGVEGLVHPVHRQLRQTRRRYPVQLLEVQGPHDSEGRAGSRFTSLADALNYQAMQRRDRLWYKTHRMQQGSAASDADDDLLRAAEEQRGQTARLTLFGNEADAADEDMLRSSSSRVTGVQRRPDAMVGMVSARHGPTLIKW